MQIGDNLHDSQKTRFDISIGDNLHEMFNPVFSMETICIKCQIMLFFFLFFFGGVGGGGWGIRKKKSAELAQRVGKLNSCMFFIPW